MATRAGTKYRVTEKVYYLEDNKVRVVEISGVYVAQDEKAKKHTYYAVQKFQSPPVGEKNWIIESRIFKTKKSLLDSL